MNNKVTNVSIPLEEYEFCKENGISLSKLLQMKISELQDKYEKYEIKKKNNSE